MVDEVFRDGAGIDEFDMGWITVLKLFDDIGSNAVVSLEIIPNAEDSNLGCTRVGGCEALLPGGHQFRKREECYIASPLFASDSGGK